MLGRNAHTCRCAYCWIVSPCAGPVFSWFPCPKPPSTRASNDRQMSFSIFEKSKARQSYINNWSIHLTWCRGIKFCSQESGPLTLIILYLITSSENVNDAVARWHLVQKMPTKPSARLQRRTPIVSSRISSTILTLWPFSAMPSPPMLPKLWLGLV